MKVGAHITVFNANMRIRRRELGLSQKDLADLTGLGITRIQDVERIRRIKVGYSGKTSADVLNTIAVALDVDFDWLFPPEYVDAVMGKRLPEWGIPILVKDIKLDELPSSRAELQLPDPEDIVAEKFMISDVNEILKEALPDDRERDVIMRRFGIGKYEKQTQSEISRVYGVTYERIRQIECVALRKLRHPRYLRRLRDYLGGQA